MKKFLTGEFNLKADPALALTLKFVLVGISWTLLSDTFLFVFGSENIFWKIAHIHILKGLLFVGVTAGFLFYWMNHFVHSLNQKEKEFKDAFKSSPVAMGILDASTFRFLDVNESLLKMFGYPLPEFCKLTLTDLAVEKEKFESVPLLIKTGCQQLALWKQLTNDNQIILVELYAQAVRDKRAYLLTFVNVTGEVQKKNESSGMREGLEEQLNARIQHLTRMNEELAYRTSQTEHVNTELISVNEQLQYVNKKVARQADQLFRAHEQLNNVLTALTEVVWSFDLSGKSPSYVSPSVHHLYEDTESNLDAPWFWLDYIHPEDCRLKERSQQQLRETGQTSCSYRIITKKGNIRFIQDRIKLIHDVKGVTFLVGCAIDITALMNGPLDSLPDNLTTVKIS